MAGLGATLSTLTPLFSALSLGLTSGLASTFYVTSFGDFGAEIDLLLAFGTALRGLVG